MKVKYIALALAAMLVSGGAMAQKKSGQQSVASGQYFFIFLRLLRKVDQWNKLTSPLPGGIMRENLPRRVKHGREAQERPQIHDKEEQKA